MQDERLGEYTVVEFVTIIGSGIVASLVAATAVGGLDVLTATIVILFAQQLGHLGALAALMSLRHRSIDTLGIDVRPTDARYVGGGIILQVALALAFRPLTERLIPDGTAQALDPILGSAKTIGTRLALGLVIAFLAPVIEEIMFRGMLAFRLERLWGRNAAIGVSSSGFAILHLGSLGGEDPIHSAIVALPQLLIVGVVFGYVALRHRRIGPSIFLHVGFNLLGVIVLIADPNIVNPA